MATTDKMRYLVYMSEFAGPEDCSTDFKAQVRELHLKLLELYLGSREAARRAFRSSFSWPRNGFVARLTMFEAILVALDDNVASVFEEVYYELD